MSKYNTERRKPAIATILNGQTTSDVIDCFAKSIVGISTPSAFTGAELTLLSSFTPDGTFKPVYDIFGNKVTITVNISTNIETNGFLANKYYKLVSDSAEGAEREIEVSLIGV